MMPREWRQRGTIVLCLLSPVLLIAALSWTRGSPPPPSKTEVELKEEAFFVSAAEVLNILKAAHATGAEMIKHRDAEGLLSLHDKVVPRVREIEPLVCDEQTLKLYKMLYASAANLRFASSRTSASNNQTIEDKDESDTTLAEWFLNDMQPKMDYVQRQIESRNK